MEYLTSLDCSGRCWFGKLASGFVHQPWFEAVEWKFAVLISGLVVLVPGMSMKANSDAGVWEAEPIAHGGWQCRHRDSCS